MPRIHSLCFAEVTHTLIQTNSHQKMGGHARLPCPTKHTCGAMHSSPKYAITGSN
jgi:hypothetical protein